MQSLAITIPRLPMLYRWSNAVPMTGNVTSRTMENLGKSVLLLGGVSITVATGILPIARRAYFLFITYDLALDTKNSKSKTGNIFKLFIFSPKKAVLDISTKVAGGVFKLIHLAAMANHHDPLVVLGAAAIQTATVLTIK